MFCVLVKAVKVLYKAAGSEGKPQGSLALCPLASGDETGLGGTTYGAVFQGQRGTGEWGWITEGGGV